MGQNIARAIAAKDKKTQFKEITLYIADIRLFLDFLKYN